METTFVMDSSVNTSLIKSIRGGKPFTSDRLSDYYQVLHLPKEQGILLK